MLLYPTHFGTARQIRRNHIVPLRELIMIVNSRNKEIIRKRKRAHKLIVWPLISHTVDKLEIRRTFGDTVSRYRS
jgi:hypothetical protein